MTDTSKVAGVGISDAEIYHADWYLGDPTLGGNDEIWARVHDKWILVCICGSRQLARRMIMIHNDSPNILTKRDANAGRTYNQSS